MNEFEKIRVIDNALTALECAYELFKSAEQHVTAMNIGTIIEIESIKLEKRLPVTEVK